MDSAPLRVCAKQGCPTLVPRGGYCPAHRVQESAHHTYRPQGAHGQGYTRGWEYFRKVELPGLLAAQGTPRVCGARLATGPSPHSRCATQGLLNTTKLHLDHDPPLQDWERSDPSRVCDPDRVGYLCASCHSAKTLREQHPTPTTAPRYVVCGPPGAGKSTWVEAHAHPGDIVWDLDKVADTVAQSPRYPRSPMVTDALMAMRRGLIHHLTHDKRATAYLIVTNDDEATRLARELGGQVVRLDRHATPHTAIGAPSAGAGGAFPS
jgi:hypothetical protein